MHCQPRCQFVDPSPGRTELRLALPYSGHPRVSTKPVVVRTDGKCDLGHRWRNGAVLPWATFIVAKGITVFDMNTTLFLYRELHVRW